MYTFGAARVKLQGHSKSCGGGLGFPLFESWKLSGWFVRDSIEDSLMRIRDDKCRSFAM